jgi:hypothetical protein
MAQQAQRSPQRVCNNVLHVIARACLLEASRLSRKKSAPGVAPVPATQDAENLDATLRARHERWRDNRYGAPPVERVWSAKDEGKKRPRGHPCFEDTMVQRAVGRI